MALLQAKLHSAMGNFIKAEKELRLILKEVVKATEPTDCLKDIDIDEDFEISGEENKDTSNLAVNKESKKSEQKWYHKDLL